MVAVFTSPKSPVSQTYLFIDNSDSCVNKFLPGFHGVDRYEPSVVQVPRSQGDIAVNELDADHISILHPCKMREKWWIIELVVTIFQLALTMLT